MSASKDKKIRKEGMSVKEARIAEQEKQQKESKKLRNYVIIGAAVIVLLIAVVVVFNSNLFYHGTAVEISGTKYTTTDFNYYYVGTYSSYYSTVYNTYGEYAGFLMPAAGESLRKQEYDNGKTWAEFFEETALKRMENVTVLCDQAKKAGYTLTEDDKLQVEDTVSQLMVTAASNGATMDNYLVYIYGKGMTEKIYRENVERDVLASSYSKYIKASFEYSDEELAEHYAEHADEYDFITYRAYFIAADDDADAAKKQADEFVAAATSEQAYIDFAASLNESEDYDADEGTLTIAAGSSVTEELKDWLLSADRKNGDVCSIETPEDAQSAGYYVLYFLGRDDNHYNTVNAYYIQIDTDAVSRSDYESDEEYEKAVSDATAQADFVFNMVKDSYYAAETQNYDSFIEACSAVYSNFGDYGELDTIGRNDVHSELADWLFDDGRKAGDIETIYNEDFGKVMLYFRGEGDSYDKVISDNVVRGEDYSNWESENSEGYSTKTTWLMSFAERVASLGG